jgi:hypothetical protein
MAINIMNTMIKYEINLQWEKWMDISPDYMRRIVEDINSFHPMVPIQETYSEFNFSVHYEKDESYINVMLTVDRNVFGDDLSDSYGILDETIVRRLKDLLFTFNLAYPGCVFISKSVLLRDGKFVTQFSYSNGFSSMACEKCKWIPFESLTIQKCWDWIVEKTGFLSYISRTPIDRALFALSYESSANDDLFIFYVLLGIEAIYNDGSNQEESISSQLRRKIQAVLGVLPPSAIKDIGKMYKRRSALVHGSADIFKCWFSEDYTEDEYEKLSKEREYMTHATGILLVTIQKFIQKNANILVEDVTVKLK